MPIANNDQIAVSEILRLASLTQDDGGFVLVILRRRSLSQNLTRQSMKQQLIGRIPSLQLGRIEIGIPR